MRNLFWLCLTLIIITSLGCIPRLTESTGPTGPTKPAKCTEPAVLFHVEQAMLSPDSLGSQPFTWPDNEDSLGDSPMRFQLIRLDSADLNSSGRRYTFTEVIDEEITYENCFSLQGLDLSELTDGRQYFWQLTGKPTKQSCGKLLAAHSFVLDAVPTPLGSRVPIDPNLRVDPPGLGEVCDTIYSGPNCRDMEIYCNPTDLIAHIVNITDETFLYRSILMQSNQADEDPCIFVGTLNTSFSFSFQFAIDVPCDKRATLQPENINLYLFSEQDLNTAKNFNYTTTINYNTGSRQLASTQIIAADYLLGCASFCTSHCRANVMIEGNVMVDFQPNGTPYDHKFVFELGSGGNHNFGHGDGSHSLISTAVSAACGSGPTNPTYTYFKCIDDLGSTAHQAEHIVIIDVPFCRL